MRITDLKLSEPIYVPFNKGMTDAINILPAVMTYSILNVTTDEGITGNSVLYHSSLLKVLIEESLKPCVVGEDPLNSERIWDKMYWDTLRYGRRGAPISAISHIDIAIWDLKGKILGQSVHRLIGGHRDSVASYATSIGLESSDEELLGDVHEFLKVGFRMIKIKLGRKEPHEDLERVRLVREAIGPKVDLAVDVNNGWSLDTAVRMAKKLEQYDVYWLEEPILADEISNMAQLARETSIPIAIGETHYTKWEFREIMEQGAAKIIQADVGKCGGVTEFLKIAALADSFGLPICPHHTEYIDVACVAGVPNGLFHEDVHDFLEPTGMLFVDPVLPRDGRISPSAEPGFGFHFNTQMIEQLTKKPAPEETKWTARRGWRWPPYL